MMKAIILAALLAPLMACSLDQSAGAQPELGIREAKQLAKALEGKVPGTPVACIPTYNGSNLQVLGDNTLIYKAGRNLVYRNTLQGRCNGLAQGDALVLNLMTSQYCRGDIAKAVNLQSGTLSGVCALGDFVPYRTPEAAGSAGK